MVALAVVGPQRVYEEVVKVDQGSRTGGSTLVSRQEVWNRASYMVQDFPFTGIGLNTFPKVLDALYPSFLAGPEAKIPHAHNIYLQTAVDLGLAGLMAFLGLWAILFRQAIQAYRRAEGPMQGAIAGLAAGCLAYLIFGITDAITLGAKPLFLLWAMAGLTVVANRLLDAETGGRGDGEIRGRGDAEKKLGTEFSALSTRHSALIVRTAREVGVTVWVLYWAVAVLLAGMAYLVVGISISGWVP